MGVGRASIEVDGRPLARFGIERWRARIGVVMQDDQLFAGSIADNIAFFDPQPDLAWIEQCARVAAVPNQAVFEVPRVLQRILDGTATTAAASVSCRR